MPNYSTMDKGQAQKSVKSLLFESANLNPSSLLTFFEIDLSTAVKGISSSLLQDADEVGIRNNLDETGKDLVLSEGENVLRFHNNIAVFNSYIIWQGNTYWPAPIEADGFDLNSRGVLPTPTLRMTSQKEEGIAALSILRRAIHKYGDIIGGKVTRIRTFAKYLDKKNFSEFKDSGITTQGSYNSPFPNEYEPDPWAEFPRDIFYVERKTGENKNALEYELSALIDVEGIKLPRRRVLSKKCSFSYRGCGCFYQQKEPVGFNATEASGNSAYQNEQPGPGTTSKLLAKCGIRDSELTLPDQAPPIADVRDQKIYQVIGVDANFEFPMEGVWKKGNTYTKGDCIYMEKNNIKYYFIARQDIPSRTTTEFAPPNPDFWVADLCSKTLEGCKLSWGQNGALNTDGTNDFNKGELQFGGFPNATRLEQTLGG